MIKAEIKCGNEQSNGSATIVATGGVNEILNDIAVLINGIHTQLSANDSVAGHLFRCSLTGLINDPNSPLWTPMDGQSGIVFKKP